MEQDSRIPLETIEDYNIVRLSGMQFGIRWSAAMDAYEAQHRANVKEFKDNRGDHLNKPPYNRHHLQS